MEHDVIPSCHTITVNYGTRRKPLNVKIHRYELRNRVLHREDGPALVDSFENQEFRQYGKLHRLDGPAVVNRVDRTISYFIDDKEVPKTLVDDIIRWSKENNISLRKINSHTKSILSMKFGISFPTP